MAESKTNSKIKQLKNEIIAAKSSIRLLFTELKDGKIEFVNIFRRKFISNYIIVLDKVANDLDILSEKPKSSQRIFNTISSESDSIDGLNQLYVDCGNKSLTDCLEEAVFDALIYHGIMKEIDEPDDNTLFFINHVTQLCKSVKSISDFIDMLLDDNLECARLSRLRPGVRELLTGESFIKTDDGKIKAETLLLLKSRSLDADPFSGGKAFRYLDGKFIPTELNSIRRITEFFGYNGVRKTFAEHFRDFSMEVTNVPLLVSSLPGLGKTHLSISHTLVHDNLSLILPEPEDLERPLQELIEKLGNRKDRKFIIFFDDVDPAKINWYYFRTNVGGSFTLPENVSIVIASNFDFPANILSRGRAVKFPLFDEIRCLEMIEEFLKSRGLKHRNPDLELVIAADYVEDFGQRKFEELSPRTLIRYLQTYQSDMKKRKRMLDMSRAEVFAKPDPQVFYEFNVKLMRSLYGEEILDVLREESLKKQIGSV